MLEKCNCLFVYGTLLSKDNETPYEFFMQNSTLLGEAHFQGKLFEVDYYPGAIASKSSEDTVHGKIFQLKNPGMVLGKLDDYEEIDQKNKDSAEFCRKLITASLGKEEIECWIYLYNKSTSSLERISSGRFNY